LLFLVKWDLTFDGHSTSLPRQALYRARRDARRALHRARRVACRACHRAVSVPLHAPGRAALKWDLNFDGHSTSLLRQALHRARRVVRHALHRARRVACRACHRAVSVPLHAPGC
ncbi:hypothetical protein HAX54_004270, partial [Datura stramonium]|nr:hypothetical protein [Datura stramonium]